MTDAPVSPADRRTDGTWTIVVGALVAGVGAYVFQILGGRTLGATGFAPVAALWTMGFLVHTILMIPVEQIIARGLALRPDRARRTTVPRYGVATLLAAIVIGTASVAATLDRFYGGDPWYIVVMFALLASRATMTVGRGTLAGHRRFAAYGSSLLGEGIVLAALGGLAAVVDGGAVAFGLAMAVAPLTVLAFRPFRDEPSTARTSQPTSQPQEGPSVLVMLLIATGLAQFILAGGPLVVGLVGGSAAAVSAFFVTFTLFRGPVTASYGLAMRFLTEMATLAGAGAVAQLYAWARRLAIVGGGVALAVGIAGYSVAPAVVDYLYGNDFRPTAAVAALGSAGVGLALTLLFSSQILVALGRTKDLAIGWGAGLLAATVVVLWASSDPALEVAVGFFVGEVVAFGLVTGATLYRTRRLGAGPLP